MGPAFTQHLKRLKASYSVFKMDGAAHENYKQVSLVIGDLRDVSFKSNLSWEIHTNVVCANDSQMAAAAKGL